jgi:hypothetical protein
MSEIPKLLHESISKYVVNGFTIRVWRQEPIDASESRTKLKEDVTAIAQQPLNALDIAKAIATLENVNAVEVLNVDAMGSVIYVGWP